MFAILVPFTGLEEAAEICAMFAILAPFTGLEEAAEIKTAMMDREGSRDRARRTSGPPTG